MARKNLILKSLFVLFALVLTGCAGSSMNPINPPAVAASGPLAFPAITGPGQTVTLEPGTYTCPTNVPSGTHIVGHGAPVPTELVEDNDFTHFHISAPPIVRIVCPAGLKLLNVAGVDFSGVILDFQNAGGFVLDSVGYSRFDMGIVDSNIALTVQSVTGNNMGNTFPRLIIYHTNTGIILQGFASTAVTWNDFGHVDIVRARDFGIIFSQFADSNTFGAVRIRLGAAGVAGVVFNDKAVLGDVDAGGNIFALLNCDGDSAFHGYCADFRGYTIGNQVLMGFGIMSDVNKVHFDNAFSAGANNVHQIQEFPKQP